VWCMVVQLYSTTSQVINSVGGMEVPYNGTEIIFISVEMSVRFSCHVSFRCFIQIIDRVLFAMKPKY
jgi:hypothetical protein